jgi:hypothetical protein
MCANHMVLRVLSAEQDVGVRENPHPLVPESWMAWVEFAVPLFALGMGRSTALADHPSSLGCDRLDVTAPLPVPS